MPEIQAVLFDFGGVMEVFQPERFRAFEARLGLKPRSLYPILWQSPDWRLAEVGTISDGEYWQRTGARLGLHTAPEIEEFRRALFDGVQPDPCLVDLVRRLGTRYRTGLLSNATDNLPRLLRDSLGIDGLFDVEVISALVGLAKPDPAIYRLALERLGTEPAATVCVDDYEPNVAAAEALGIRGVHFVGYEALIPALEEQGVVLPG